MLKREKKYQIKQISRDGLLKNVERYGHEVLYNTYDTEEEAWIAIEKEWRSQYRETKARISPWMSLEYTVIELWVVCPEED